VVQDIVRDLQQTVAQPELDLLSTQTHSSMSGEYSPMSMVTPPFPSPLDHPGKNAPLRSRMCQRKAAVPSVTNNSIVHHKTVVQSSHHGACISLADQFLNKADVYVSLQQQNGGRNKEYQTIFTQVSPSQCRLPLNPPVLPASPICQINRIFAAPQLCVTFMDPSIHAQLWFKKCTTLAIGPKFMGVAAT